MNGAETKHALKHTGLKCDIGNFIQPDIVLGACEQAAVNNELGILEQAIEDMAGLLAPGGRLCIITFHSLEDRIVKQTFHRLEHPCTCPPEFPVCVCGKKPSIRVITRKPILPSEEELEFNPRARSAKLRILEKL